MKMDCDLNEIYRLVNDAMNRDEIKAFAAEFRQFPLRLSYSSYADGIRWLAGQYRSFGLETEVVSFPADGKTVYADRHFPLAWDISDAWAEVGGKRIADYRECTYCAVPFSADSGGVCTGSIVPVERLPEQGSLEPFVVLIAHYPSGAEIKALMRRSCKAFMTAVDLHPVHPSLEDSRRWFNDLFGAGQIDCRDKTCVGFSLTPRIARELMERYEKSGPVPVRYRMDTRTYEGEAPAVTALLRGEDDRCFFLTSHAYEPHATNNVSGVATALSVAKTLASLIGKGKLPRPKHSIRFFHGLENFSLYAWGMAHPELMKNAVGGVSVDSFGRLETGGRREHFVLRRSLNVHPSAQHALAREILKNVSEEYKIGFEVREGSKNNEDMMQDPMFGPPWNLFYGSLWEEPLETYPRCYFYHTSVDTPDRLSPAALGAGAAFSGTLAYFTANAGAEESAFLSELAFEDWKRIVDDKCREALRLADTEEASRLIRARRLAAWRDLSIPSGMTAVGNAALADEFKAYAVSQVGAALRVLNGGEAPPLCSGEHREVLVRRVPGPIGLGTLNSELRELAAEAQGYESNEYWCLDDSGTNFFHFDGRKTVFEVALAAWATRPYPLQEDPGGFARELEHYSKLAEVLLRSGLAEPKICSPVLKHEIAAGLHRLGVAAGDVLMVHSSLKSFGKVDGGADTVIDALLESVTEEGILAMPAFTDCESGSPNPPYDPAVSPVEKWVGIVPETFRRRNGVKRSIHPTHSVCACGKRAEEFLHSETPYDTFAEDSPWGKLLRYDGKILFLGESIGGNTFLHAAEAWFAGYLDKTFAEVALPGGGRKQVLVTNYPGGCRGGWYKLGRNAAYFRKLKQLGIVRETVVGQAVLTMFHARELADAMRGLLAEDPALLLHKSGCRDCAKHRAVIR